ncbi:MAG TPA: caspase family protein, partial [Acidimicrobiales bacterium]
LSQGGWQPSHILELLDGAATAANIRSAMSWLVAHSSPNSFTVFHYSGHVCEQGRGPCSNPDKYMWPVDNRLISGAEFAQRMRGLQGWSWIDISGCEAAAFDQGVSSPQRFFTGSSMGNETSYEVPGWHESVWTGLLVQQGILERQAATGGGPVSIQQAVRWAQQRATQMTANQPAGAQHPYAVGGTGAWFIAQGAAPPGQPSTGSGGQPPPAPAAKPAPPPPNRCPSITQSILTC